jgi:VanZ family protein
MQMKSWIYRWGPAIVIMAIIFIASATPGSDIPRLGHWDEFFKKGGHMLGYALLATAFYHALNTSKGGIKLQSILVLCIVALYATSDEFHQRFTPGRSASIRDVGIDVTGGLLGITVMRFVQGQISLHGKKHTR